jgi:serine/threonine protein phosphatase 1
MRRGHALVRLPAMGRTIAIGDIHGEIEHLDRLLGRLPRLQRGDTLVFLGDYVDRGPDSARVVARVREIQQTSDAKVVALRGNHEDAWIQVAEKGWPEFIIPRGNGCLEALRSFTGQPPPGEEEAPSTDELKAMLAASFLPPDVVGWMRELPYFYEDEHAIYVHAGLVHKDKKFEHPSTTEPRRALLWTRDKRFFAEYRGKLVVVGHTATKLLPPELSSFTPEDPTDLWAGPAVIAIDTACGKPGGFLTAVELPAKLCYESR